MADAVSQLAAQLATATTSAAPQPTIIQGVIVSWQSTATPPSATVTLSGDTAQIPGIQYSDGYTPVPGDVVQIAKQNGSLMIIGSLNPGGGWITPSLASGVSQNGNGQGTLMYRIVQSGGAQKCELQGAVNTGGHSNLFGITPVPSIVRSIVAPGDNTGGSMVRIDVHTDGGFNIIQASGTSGTFSGFTSAPGTDGGNTGSGPDGHTHTDGHGHTMTHNHSIAWGFPSWVGFDGVSFYL